MSDLSFEISLAYVCLRFSFLKKCVTNCKISHCTCLEQPFVNGLYIWNSLFLPFYELEHFMPFYSVPLNHYPFRVESLRLLCQLYHKFFTSSLFSLPGPQALKNTQFFQLIFNLNHNHGLTSFLSSFQFVISSFVRIATPSVVLALSPTPFTSLITS